MPWDTEGDNVSFSGPLADLMGIIMTAYDHDCVDGADSPTPGEYVTASAVVLREVVLENFDDDPQAAEFVAHVSDAMSEDDEGHVHVATFALLDEIAEHIDTPALDYWLGTVAVRNAILELAAKAFA